MRSPTMMSTDSNSPFATVIGLGSLKAEYKNSGRRRWVGLIFGILCLLASPVLLLLTVYVAYVAYNNSGLYKVADSAVLPLIGTLVAFVIGVADVVKGSRRLYPAPPLHCQ